MKKTGWLILSAMLTTGLLAQQTTTPRADKPAAKPAAKPAPKKPAPGDEVRSTPLVAGPATVVARNVNVRGLSRLKGEILTRLNQGDAVTVIEEIILKNSKADEPSAWAKIVLPAGVNAWVHTSFIDAATKTVKPNKLNLRGGPGENYSVIGLLERGAAVKEVSAKGHWMEIEAPEGAYAFVAAQYLQQAAPVIPAPAVAAAAPKPVESAPTPVTVAEPAPIATTTTETPTPAPVAAPVVATPTPEPAPVAVPEPVTEEPPPQRIVQHEGIVKGAWSIQAPTKFALVSPGTGKIINYLYTTSTNLDLSRYKGLHIVVTGEEGLDARWKNHPVITIQRIQVLE